ncbi:conserved hypothetical protein, partial [Trichinella spiralis]|uniref:hypothetical protein n=1 Tax=Trichinella spiralis TaxID=6334 RepID=UPI0001EFEBD2
KRECDHSGGDVGSGGVGVVIYSSTTSARLQFIGNVRRFCYSMTIVVCGLLEKMANNWVSVVYSNRHLLVNVADNFLTKLSSAGVVVDLDSAFLGTDGRQQCP